MAEDPNPKDPAGLCAEDPEDLCAEDPEDLCAEDPDPKDPEDLLCAEDPDPKDPELIFSVLRIPTPRIPKISVLRMAPSIGPHFLSLLVILSRLAGTKTGGIGLLSSSLKCQEQKYVIFFEAIGLDTRLQLF